MGTLCSIWKVETSICTRDWVCGSFSLEILIGKSNTPLMRIQYFIFGFKKVPVCVLVSSKSRGTLCGGSPRGVLLCSRLSCWVLVASSGENCFWAILHRIQCSFMSMDLRRLLVMLLVTTLWAVVLSVRIRMGGCSCPISLRA